MHLAHADAVDTATVDRNRLLPLRSTDSRTAMTDSIRRAMLAPTADVGDWDVAVRYLPADTAQRIGGDWYDAIAGPRGRLTLVIGDVAGHDIAAAARMSQLRTHRARSPRDLLSRAADNSGQYDDITMLAVRIPRIAVPGTGVAPARVFDGREASSCERP
jgi:hypothetical protein